MSNKTSSNKTSSNKTSSNKTSSKATVMITGLRRRQFSEEHLPILTKREIEIVALASLASLASLGLSAAAIAKILFISERTISFHMDNVLACVREKGRRSGSLVNVLNLLGTWTPHDPALAAKVAEFKAKLSL